MMCTPHKIAEIDTYTPKNEGPPPFPKHQCNENIHGTELHPETWMVYVHTRCGLSDPIQFRKGILSSHLNNVNKEQFDAFNLLNISKSYKVNE